jgi:hypothetical protein
MLDSLRAARRSLATHRRLLLVAWYGGAVVLGLGFLASLDGRWSIALPALAVGVLLMWLTGGWVLPRSSESYARRVRRVFDDWSAYAHWVEGRHAYRNAKAERRLSSLSPPDGLQAEHERLLGLVAELAAAWHDEAAPFAERARRETSARLAAKDLLETIRSRATTDAGVRYLAELDRVRDAQQDEYASAAADSDRAAADAVRKLERITPPPATAHDHEELATALRAHLAATLELRAAGEALDPDRAATAAAAWDEATRRVQDQAQRIAERHDYAAGRPVADEAPR